MSPVGPVARCLQLLKAAIMDGIEAGKWRQERSDGMLLRKAAVEKCRRSKIP